MIDLDINGFLQSTEFLAQIAVLVATFLNLIVQKLLGGLLGAS